MSGEDDVSETRLAAAIARAAFEALRRMLPPPEGAPDDGKEAGERPGASGRPRHDDPERTGDGDGPDAPG